MDLDLARGVQRVADHKWACTRLDALREAVDPGGTEVDELPNREELDSMFPNNPVYLEEKHSKMCICNSLALETVGETGITRVDEEDLLYKAVDIPTLDPVDDYLRESELELAIEIASKNQGSSLNKTVVFSSITPI